ncbi:unnamed protein product [Heligmosomoides polygyrus]|uniref:Sulfate_transp domain-containing protein n=1 Tax=Heligmosomoides polygyrus TaxID=6339 RepID=A0A3P7WHX0_HELPZ|nr:unnamed protein product [Heligmosomoides polygyrus]
MVAIVHVPQGLAYAILAGVNPVVGLYTSFFPVLAYMLFGTSRHSSIGTIAIVAIMTGSAVNKYAVPSGVINVTNVNASFPTRSIVEPIEVTIVLSFAAGLTQIIIAVVGLDFVTTYFSEQVVDGFATAAAMHAMVAQLKDITGIYDTPRRSGAGNVVMVRALELSHCNCRFNKRRSPVPIPFELLLVRLQFVEFGFIFIQRVQKQFRNFSLPVPTLPRWKLLSYLALDAIPIAVVSVAIHISMAKLLAKKHNYTLDLKQEFYAVGFATTISSFFPVIPCCCSVARTLLNSQTGGNTQFLFSAIFSSLFVFFVLQFGGKFLQPVPMVCYIVRWFLNKLLAIWVVAFTATTFIDVIIGLAVSIIFALFTTVIRQQL